MSSREFNKEERRLRRAKEEMLQVLHLLEDRYMEDSNLTQDEKTRLLDEGQKQVAEILTAIAHFHSKETSITDNRVMENIMRPVAEILRVAGDVPSGGEVTAGPFDSAEIMLVPGDIASGKEVTAGPFHLTEISWVGGDIPSRGEVKPGPPSFSGRTLHQVGHWRLTLGTGDRLQSSSDSTLDQGEQGEGEPTH